MPIEPIEEIKWYAEIARKALKQHHDFLREIYGLSCCGLSERESEQKAETDTRFGVGLTWEEYQLISDGEFHKAYNNYYERSIVCRKEER